VIAVEPSCTWDVTWVQEALSRLSGLRSKTAFVRVLFVAGPRTAWRLEHGGGLEALLADARVVPITLRTWHDTTVRSWLDDLKVPTAQADKHFEAFRSRTGKWPALLYELAEMLTPNAIGRWKAEIERFEDTWKDAERLRRRQAALGLDLDDALPILRLLAQVQEASVQDLVALGEFPHDTVRHVIRWADLLGLVAPKKKDIWRIDSVAKRILDLTAGNESILVESAGA
jgi:hypothetical protein